MLVKVILRSFEIAEMFLMHFERPNTNILKLIPKTELYFFNRKKKTKRNPHLPKLYESCTVLLSKMKKIERVSGNQFLGASS